MNRSVNYDNMLRDYAQIAEKRGIAAEATAIRTESTAFRDILAHLASFGNATWQEIAKSVLRKEDRNYDMPWLAALARVAALQNKHSRDLEFALEAFSIANPHLERNAKTRRFRKLEIEILIDLGEDETALRILANDADLAPLYYRYLKAELQNPFRDAKNSNYNEWIKSFNAPLKARGLDPISVPDGDSTPFNRITTSNALQTIDGELVSIIITTYEPDIADLKHSVTSLLRQTWRNLEIIIVDDGSTTDLSQALEEITASDQRVRLVRNRVNGGTYAARNIGLREANGTFITGQDTDDWSHPQRIERQVATLEQHADAPGCRVHSIAASPDLIRVRPGYNPNNPNASSLMFRSEHLRTIGGYIEARKAADTEFQKRLEQVAGAMVVDIKEPLTIVRILPQSLSRADFRAGWSHPARRQFKSAYALWHRSTPATELKISSGAPCPVPIPTRLQGNQQPAAPHFDVIFGGDWRQFGGPQKSMLEEIKALTNAKYRVGILHLEAPRFMSSTTKTVCEPIQELINNGVVDDVLYDDPVDTKLLIVRYPPIFQFPPHEASSIRAHRLIILANQAPSERDGTDIRYEPNSCSSHATQMFGRKAMWVPQGPTARSALGEVLEKSHITPYDMPGIVNPYDWRIPRLGYRSMTPVIGRHSRDNVMKWPENASDIASAYPLDGDFDVRVMGGGSTPQSVLGTTHTPPSWVVFDVDEIPVKHFLSSLDFYIFFPHSNSYEAFGRAILEALAAGCVTILPKQFAAVFGDAAIYREPTEVQETVETLYNDREAYLAQSRLATREVANKFSHGSYVKSIDYILEQHPDAFTANSTELSSDPEGAPL